MAVTIVRRVGWVGGGCAHLHCTVPQSQVVTSQAVSHLVTPTADTGTRVLETLLVMVITFLLP